MREVIEGYRNGVQQFVNIKDEERKEFTSGKIEECDMIIIKTIMTKEEYKKNQPCSHTNAEFINRNIGGTHAGRGVITGGTYYSHFCPTCNQYLLWPFKSSCEHTENELIDIGMGGKCTRCGLHG